MTTPIFSTHHGDLPATAHAAAPTTPQVPADKAHTLLGPVNAALALHAPIVEFQDADNPRRPGACAHCGKALDDSHFRDEWYGNLLCPNAPDLKCSHCLDGIGGYAEWPCATVKALTVGL